MMGEGPRRKIYIGSHGSIAMTLEKVVGESKGIGHLLGTYLGGTKEEIEKEYRGNAPFYQENPEYLRTGTLYFSLMSMAGMSSIVFMGAGGADIESLGGKLLSSLGSYLVLDTLWRIRPSSIGSGGVSSGLIGSMKGAIQGFYGRKQTKKMPIR